MSDLSVFGTDRKDVEVIEAAAAPAAEIVVDPKPPVSSGGSVKKSKTMLKNLNFPVLTDAICANPARYNEWRDIVGMMVIGMELAEDMSMDVLPIHPDYSNQMMAKSLLYMAVSNVKGAMMIVGRAKNGKGILEGLDKLYRFQKTAAGRMHALQQFQQFRVLSGESIQATQDRYLIALAELGEQVGEKTLPAEEIQISNILLLCRDHHDAAVRARVQVFLNDSESVARLTRTADLFEQLRNAEYQGKVFGGAAQNVNLMQQRPRGGSRGTPTRPCRHCGGRGHWDDDCKKMLGQSNPRGHGRGTPGAGAASTGAASVKPGGKTISCYTCGEPGHVAAHCRGGRKCFCCGGTGHTQSECPSKKPAASAPGSAGGQQGAAASGAPSGAAAGGGRPSGGGRRVLNIGAKKYEVPVENENELEQRLADLVNSLGMKHIGVMRVENQPRISDENQDVISSGAEVKSQDAAAHQDVIGVNQNAEAGVNLIHEESKTKSQDVILDSGAAVDCTGDPDIFTREVTLGGPVLVSAVGEAVPTVKHGYVDPLLEDVNYARGLNLTLKSVGLLDKRGDITVTGAGRMRVLRDGDVIAVGELRDDGLYHYDMGDPLFERGGDDPLRVTITQSGAHVDVGHDDDVLGPDGNQRICLVMYNQLGDIIKTRKNYKVTPERLHEILGHPAMTELGRWLRRGELSGVDLDPGEINPGCICDGCKLGKPKKRGHSLSKSEPPSSPFEEIASDVFGPIHPATPNGGKYFSVHVCLRTRYCFVHILRTKDEVLDAFEKVVQEVGVLGGGKFKIRRHHSDNGGEYTSGRFRDFCAEKGIRQTFTAPDTPEQNGVSERRGGRLKDIARTMMAQTKVPGYLWGYAVKHAAYLVNRLPAIHRTERFPSPYEMVHGEAPCLKKLVESNSVFGCRAYVKHISSQHLGAFEERAWEGIYVGEDESSRAKLVFNLKTRTVYRRDSIILTGLPGLWKDSNGKQIVPEEGEYIVIDWTIDDTRGVEETTQGGRAALQQPPVVSESKSEERPRTANPNAPVVGAGSGSDAAASTTDLAVGGGGEDEAYYGLVTLPDETDEIVVASLEDAVPEVGEQTAVQTTVLQEATRTEEQQPAQTALPWRSSRNRQSTSERLSKDYCLSKQDEKAERDRQPRGGTGRNARSVPARDSDGAGAGVGERSEAAVGPVATSAEAKKVDGSVSSVALKITDAEAPIYLLEELRMELSGEVPKTYHEATTGPDRQHWIPAVIEELKSLKEREVFTVESAVPGRKVVGCKWVFDAKKNDKGEIVRYKARLVAQGFTQRWGVDYTETYAPTVRPESIRLLFALAAVKDLDLRQVDVKTAFLYGELPENEEVFMRPPEGIPGAGGTVWRLKKALYGLKQASMLWNKKLDGVLADAGFKRTVSDNCFYVKHGTGNKITLLIVHVDDILIASNDAVNVSSLMVKLKASFEIKDLGEARLMLGMKITRNRRERWIEVNQERMVGDIVQKYGDLVDQEFSTRERFLAPGSREVQLTREMEASTVEEKREMGEKPYRELVGCLTYLATMTRYDIATEVGILSRFLNNPGREHWRAALRVVGYLREHPSRGLMFDARGRQDVTLSGFTDSDHAGDLDTRRSVSGWGVFLSGMLIAWGSKRQSVVTLSSTEAEWYAATQLAQQLLWSRSILGELGFNQEEAIVIHEDNNACIYAAHNSHYKKMRHVDVRLMFLKELIAEKVFVFQRVASKDNIADIWTKVLDAKQRNYLMDKITSGDC
jgi:transposase InsO family protein